LDEGIRETESFTAECPTPQVYREFLEKYKPDAVHIHTLMGLHKEFLESARELGIRIVFTSHDYFGICPKVTLFQEDKVCDGNCEGCAECNESALSLKKIKILQSGLYRGVKDSAPVKLLRKRHRKKFFDNEKPLVESEEQSVNCENTSHKSEKPERSRKDYEKLRRFYMDLLGMVDIIHFNSSVTEAVYRRFIPETIKGKVINISHNNIEDCRKKKQFGGILKITYLAPAKAFKGYEIMKQAMDELWNEGIRDFELNLYNGVTGLSPYMKCHEHFAYSELADIFDKTDMLIAPSVWYETFGFTVLEALSFGVPVLVSTNVGCKDLLEKGTYGMVIKPTKEEVKQAVKYVIEHREILSEYNRRIVEEMNFGKVLESSQEIEKLYQKK
jgi:glycosyltransferase involved in cell wall biosynthesis